MQPILKPSSPIYCGFLIRARYQLTLGIVIAILIPAITSHFVMGLPLRRATESNTAVGGIIALLLGYLSYRKLQVFPGITAGGYIITSLTLSFGILATSFVLFRLEYSRVQFLLSYIITVFWFTAIQIRIVSRRNLVLGVIPGGATDRLPMLDNVIWHRLESPQVIDEKLEGVVADLNFDHSDEWDKGIASLALQGIRVFHIKQAIEQLTGRIEVEHLSENTLGALNPNAVFLKAKALIDISSAIVLLAIALPLMALIGLIVRLDSPGPALFRQQRTGFRAIPFTVYKFRTMRQPDPVKDTDDARGRAITKDSDPRITKLGSFLRKSRLDELPQLFNVVRGEMSLIGPRPEAIELTRWYEEEIPFYHYRHIIKPGITGWAQINQGHVTGVDEVREKLHLDFYYVKNFSFWLDCLIILRTIQTMITGRGAR